MEGTIFWDMTTCSMVKVYQHLKMEAVPSFETLVNFYKTRQCHILKDSLAWSLEMCCSYRYWAVMSGHGVHFKKRVLNTLQEIGEDLNLF
jgi:hypothetical protein